MEFVWSRNLRLVTERGTGVGTEEVHKIDPWTGAIHKQFSVVHENGRMPLHPKMCLRALLYEERIKESPNPILKEALSSRGTELKESRHRRSGMEQRRRAG